MKIIAEVAQGYEGRPDYCRLYVRAAARAGAHAVKFQVVYADDVAEPGYRYYDFYKTLEMPVEVWRETREAARAAGLLFFTDVSGERACEVARAVRPDGIKLHSSNFFNRALLRRAFELADRVFVSLGGIEAEEVDALVREVSGWGRGDRLALLYGFQAEPTPVEQSHLARLPLLRARYPGVEIGYMDHAAGAGPDTAHLSALALALGADWVEKHLTLSRYLEIEDHVSAIEPDEFAAYAATLARLSGAFGTPDLVLDDAERSYRDRMVKKLVAARDLAAGTRLAAADLAHLRSPRIPTGEGFHDPARVVGRRIARALARGEPLLARDMEEA